MLYGVMGGCQRYLGREPVVSEAEAAERGVVQQHVGERLQPVVPEDGVVEVEAGQVAVTLQAAGQRLHACPPTDAGLSVRKACQTWRVLHLYA